MKPTFITFGDYENQIAKNIASTYFESNVFDVVNNFKLEIGETAEDTESSALSDKLRWANFLSEQKIGAKVYVILSSASEALSATLTLLEDLKDKSIEIFYIRKPREALEVNKRLEDRAVFGILQEYTRSAIFDKFLILSEKVIEDMNEELTIINYDQQMQASYANLIGWLMRSRAEKPLLSSERDDIITARIGTIGVMNYESEKTTSFYELQFPRKTRLYLWLNQTTLGDKNSLTKIRNLAKMSDNTGYRILRSPNETNFVYFEKYATIPQEMEMIEE